MFWNKLLKEVMLCRNSGIKSFSFIGVEENERRYISDKRRIKQLPRPVPKLYGLGPKYEGVRFSQREAECMVQLLKGKTVYKVAEAVHLSPRTIEYYLKNMKAKLGCRTKFELVELVADSDFLKNIDF